MFARHARTLGACVLILIAATWIGTVPSHADDPTGMPTPADKNLFPKAYGLLANEHLMFPVDLADWPVKIDGSRQLLVDDYLVASIQNVKRTVHYAEKHPDNPIFSGDKPWEGAGPVFQIVHRDESTGRFRMWYAGCGGFEMPSGVRVRFPALYAESADGITWQKPELGLHEYEGSKANNIVIPAGNLFGLIIDPEDPDAQRRYKGIVWHEPKYVPREGYFLYTSPDGINWTRRREEPLAVSLHGYTMPQSGIGDTTIFRWDPKLRKYVGDVKFVLPGKMRCRGTMESDDLIHWTRPRMTIYPDSLDDSDSQIYGNLSFCYESMWLGFLRVMHTGKSAGYKQTTVELTASRDGRHWTRVGKREEVIPLGSEEEWDSDYHDPAPEPVSVGDELWIYYRNGKLRRNETRRYDIGLAKLRTDGFVSLDAGEQPGVVTTRPLSFEGKRLFINAEVEEGGSIKVGLLSYKGDPVENHAGGDCVPITAGAVKIPATWKQATEYQLPTGQHVRLRFELTKAKLYAFWIE